LRLIELRMPYSLSAAWNWRPQYWLPLSLWQTSPGGGRRRNHAMRNASTTRLACMCGCRLQPTIWRLCRSMIAAKYSQPSSVAT